MSHSLHNYAYIPMDIRPVMLRLASFGFHPTNIPVVYVLCVCSICSINNAVRNGFILGNVVHDRIDPRSHARNESMSEMSP